MKILDQSFTTPEENIACDEALLNESEASGGAEVLRFWTSRNYFAVLGYSNAWKEELKTRTAVPVLRRCSGGGAVLQGPGCLNYSLILKIPHDDVGAHSCAPLRGIVSTNRYVMEKNRAALETLLGKTVRVQGHTDLTLEDRKFSGNSQRRLKKRLLFHGTFLLDFDLAKISGILKPPPKEPAYRAGRKHGAFVMNLEVSPEKIKRALASAWRAEKDLEDPPLERMQALTAERYSKEEWNFKF